jgi:hypothetical protein
LAAIGPVVVAVVRDGDLQIGPAHVHSRHDLAELVDDGNLCLRPSEAGPNDEQSQ